MMRKRFSAMLALCLMFTALPVAKTEEAPANFDPPEVIAGQVDEIVDEVTFELGEESEPEDGLEIRNELFNASPDGDTDAAGALSKGPVFAPDVVDTKLETEPAPLFAGASPEGVAIDASNFPDAGFRAWILTEIDADGDGVLSDAEIASTTEIELYDTSIASLQGIERFTALEVLTCEDLGLTELNVSLTNLRQLYLYEEKLAALTLNDRLAVLECTNGRLSGLDVSRLKQLVRLNVDGNRLTRLDVSGNPKLTDLSCVDNLLTDLTLGPRLINLNCADNRLTELDVTAAPKLRTLVCAHNRLSSLDLGDSRSLVELRAEGNLLTRLDIAACPALIDVRRAEPDASDYDNSVCYSDSVAFLSVDANVAIAVGPEGLALTAASADIGIREKVPVVSANSGISASECTFITSNKKVASVSDAGVITGIKAGKAKITVTAPNGETSVCAVTVKKAPAKVAMSVAKVSLGIGQVLSLTAKLTSGTASQITWTSSDDSVACVRDGEVTALDTGSATITARTFNGKTAKCLVTVQDYPVDMKLPVSELTLGVKQTYAVSPLLSPESAGGSITYTSSDESVVAVTAAGKLTARKQGFAVVRAETYNGLEAELAVTVLAAPSKVTLNASKRTMGVGETFQLAAATPAGSWSTFTFKSSKASVASVTADGMVTVKKTGKAKITVKTYNGKSAAFTVTAKKKPVSVKLGDASVTLGVGQQYAPKATLSSGAASELTWTSDDETVAAFDGAKLNAVGIGSANIAATTYNGLTATCAVTVLPAPTSVGLGDHTLTLSVGMTRKLSAKAAAAGYDACADSFSFATGNAKIVAVNAEGKLTARKAGSATVTVRTWNGLTDTCAVTVVAAPTKLVLKPEKTSIEAGETMRMGYALTPASSVSEVTWSTSNAAVATVDASGLVTGVAKGVATITGKTHNGKKATYKLTVIEPTVKVTGLSLNLNRLSLEEGQSWLLTAQVLPENASNRGIRWTTDDISVATVQDGEVRAVGVGACRITAIADGNPECMAVCTVTVREKADNSTLKKVELALDVVNMAVGERAALEVRILTTDLAMADLEFRTSDDHVVTVDNQGRLTAVGIGTARVWVGARNNVGAYAECSVKVEKGVYNPTSDFRYVIQNGECTITEYVGSATTVVTPATIEGYPVTGIGDYAFARYTGGFIKGTNVQKVTVSSGVRSIGKYAFAMCESLTGVSLPDSVASIGSNAFYQCSKLTDVDLPKGLTAISDSCFHNCSRLKSIQLPEKVTSVGTLAFAWTGLEEIAIPDGVTSIAAQTFYKCSSLKNVRFPKRLTAIGKSAFEGCSGLTDIVIPAGVTTIGGSAFYDCVKLEHAVLPESLKEIPEYLFMSCHKLSQVIIPENVAKIGQYAIEYCEGITDVWIPASVTNMNKNAIVLRSNATLHVVADSYAETWAKEKGFAYATDYAYEAQDEPVAMSVSDQFLGVGMKIAPQGVFSDGRERIGLLEFTSSDPDVVEVSGPWLIARKLGNATITARCISVDAEAKFVARVVYGISPEKLEIQTGQQKPLAECFVVVLNGADADTPEFENGVWSSSDSSVATVDSNGMVHGVSAGVAAITCRQDRAGLFAQCQVVVIPGWTFQTEELKGRTLIHLDYLGKESEIANKLFMLGVTDEHGDEYVYRDSDLAFNMSTQIKAFDISTDLALTTGVYELTVIDRDTGERFKIMDPLDYDESYKIPGTDDEYGNEREYRRLVATTGGNNLLLNESIAENIRSRYNAFGLREDTIHCMIDWLKSCNENYRNMFLFGFYKYKLVSEKGSTQTRTNNDLLTINVTPDDLKSKESELQACKIIHECGHAVDFLSDNFVYHLGMGELGEAALDDLALQIYVPFTQWQENHPDVVLNDKEDWDVDFCGRAFFKLYTGEKNYDESGMNKQEFKVFKWILEQIKEKMPVNSDRVYSNADMRDIIVGWTGHKVKNILSSSHPLEKFWDYSETPAVWTFSLYYEAWAEFFASNVVSERSCLEINQEIMPSTCSVFSSNTASIISRLKEAF